MPAVVVLLLPVVFIQRKRREVLSAEEELFQVDDDEYWENGWYYNPNDPCLFVQDRMSDMNFSMNMARPAAKAICGATAAVAAAALLFAAFMVMRFETAEVRFIRDGGQIEISAAGYECDFAVSEVKAAELLDEMPEEKFLRTNGGSTDHYDIGYYTGMETGKCMMFLYAGYEPVLKIRLENQTVFVNSKQAGQVEKWFGLLAADSGSMV